LRAKRQEKELVTKTGGGCRGEGAHLANAEKKHSRSYDVEIERQSKRGKTRKQSVSHACGKKKVDVRSSDLHQERNGHGEKGSTMEGERKKVPPEKKKNPNFFLSESY